MRRFEVYFLQKKVGGVWETLERGQSVSLLVASLVREFDSREDAEVRILAGAYDEGQEEWEYTQIFFVDRGAIELTLAERGGAEDDGAAETGGDAPADSGWPVADWRTATRGTPPAAEDDGRETVPGGHDFADAIRRASDESEEREPAVDEFWRARRGRIYDGREADDLPPVGPPPRFDERRARSGKAFFVVGTLLIALILTGAAVLALGIALDLPVVRPLLSLVQGQSDGDGAPAALATDAVMPKTTGKVVTYAGVAPGLLGRWSPGRCDQTYIEFDDGGLVVGTPGGQQSLKVPVVETLEDDYTWYVRRSPDLVEHFQKLGPSDLQLVGDTTRIGFSARTSDILTRCP